MKKYALMASLLLIGVYATVLSTKHLRIEREDESTFLMRHILDSQRILDIKILINDQEGISLENINRIRLYSLDNKELDNAVYIKDLGFSEFDGSQNRIIMGITFFLSLI